MRGIALLASVIVLGGSTAAPQAPSAADLARQIQAHYDTVRDFTADFTQSHKGALLKQTSVERGRLIVKKQNKLRVSYTSPQKKEFVADGTTFYAHFVEDKFGTETPLPKAGDASIALLFLAGRGNLLTDFIPSVPAAQPGGNWQLVLKPKSAQADFDTLTLIVDRASLKLTGLVTEKAESGTSTFAFTNLRENANVSDREFQFSWPKGTDVRR